MRINLIAALDRNRGIGFKNQLLCHLPADLKWFKDQTMKHPILMGKHTFESIGRVLPGRKNIVVSKTMTNAPSDLIVVNSLNDAFDSCLTDEACFVIGGSRMFTEALPKANSLYITQIHHEFEADTWFPAFSEIEWSLIMEEHHSADNKNVYPFTFQIWNRV